MEKERGAGGMATAFERQQPLFALERPHHTYYQDAGSFLPLPLAFLTPIPFRFDF